MDIAVRSAGTWKPVSQNELEDLVEGAVFVTWYDTITTNPDSIDVLDLAIPAFLDAVPTFSQLLGGRDADLHSTLDEAGRLLSKVPKGTDLWDWDFDAQELKLLFQATTGGANKNLPSFGPARCTKLLHRKRPHCIPIIDSTARAHWGGDPDAPWTTDEMVSIVGLMKEELGVRTAELDGIVEAIEKRWNVTVTRLRAYDVLSYLWHREHGPS